MRLFLTFALTLFTAGACVAGVSPAAYEHTPATAADSAPHNVTATSSADFSTTLMQLQAAIDARGFRTFAVIDHAAGAASVGEPLRPTTLVIFGNPKGGAPVMQAAQAMGLELPLKMLVAEDADGAVRLIWGDMTHVFDAYGIAEHPAKDKMAAALSAIAHEAGASRKE